MQYKSFDIPTADAEQPEQELNHFVRGHRVISVQRELVRKSLGAYWALCVEYLDGVARMLGAWGKAGAKAER